MCQTKRRNEIQSRILVQKEKLENNEVFIQFLFEQPEEEYLDNSWSSECREAIADKLSREAARK